MYDREEFYHGLLHALDAPANDANLDALRAWGECEGSQAEWNPLDTTQHEDGATEYNSFQSGGSTMHVWNYPDKQTGIKATVDTLHNGYYPHIVEAFKSGHGRQIVHGEARREVGTWGTNADCIASKLQADAQADRNEQPAQHATQPVALGPDDSAAVNRLARHLSAREHRLTNDDKDRLAHLLHAIEHAARVK